jgi:hypothetical protein
MSRARQSVFLAIVLLLFFMLLEGTLRGGIAIQNGSLLSLWYGLDADLSVDVRSLRRLKVEFHRSTLAVDVAALQPPPSDLGKIQEATLWAFGGSTTEGGACGQSSSWPAALQELLPNSRVVNYGRSGRNSDYSYTRLLGLLATGERPDVVLWANRVNETDVISLGPGLNQAALVARFPYLHQLKSQAGIVFVKRLDKTLKKYSLFYLFLAELGRVLGNKQGQPAPRLDPPRPEELQMALANYQLNTEAAWVLARRYGFRLILVMLPITADYGTPDHVDLLVQFTPLYRQAAHQFSERPEVDFLDTVPAFDAALAPQIFCDAVHQTKAGNHQIAQEVARQLLTLE